MATDTGFGKVRLFDDFLGDQVQDEWSFGYDSGGSGPTYTVDPQVNGVLLLKTDDNADGDEVSLTLGLNWQASDGGMIMEARIRSVTAITTRLIFVGFTDVLAVAGTLEEPLTQTTSTVAASADNAVGLLYDTASDNDTWYCVGVKAQSVASDVDTTIAPAADTWQTLKVVVNTVGTAHFFIDGAYQGEVKNAITVSTDCTPIVCVASQGASGAKSLDVDYVFVEGGRN